MMTDNKIGRHELKHQLSYLESMVLSNHLKAIFKKDDHTLKNGYYIVNSLYFDNHQDAALKEKINGLLLKEKYRIRYYNEPNDHFKLERKYKIGDLCYKETSKLNKEEVIKLIKGNYEDLKTDDPNKFKLFLRMKNKGLKAKSIVSYQREAFIFKAGNVRITIDTKLKISNDIRSFLTLDTPFLSTKSDQAILEVKYDRFLPSIVEDALGIICIKTSNYSKYAISRIIN